MNLTFHNEGNNTTDFQNDKSKLKEKKVFRNTSQNEMLRIIEKSFDYLLEKYKFYVENKLFELKEYEKEIEVLRKKKVNDDQKIEFENKKENLKNKILERYNKVSIMPKRKIANKVRPLSKEKKETKQNTLKTEISITDYIYYDD